MRDELRSRSLVDFFGTINRRDVCVQKRLKKEESVSTKVDDDISEWEKKSRSFCLRLSLLK